jgi:hypothetical protein
MLRYYVGGILDRLNHREHDADGAHNALEIPRTVGRVLYSAGYTTGTFNSRLSSVANPAVGTVTATLAGGGEFTSPYMLPMACPLTAGDTRPCVAAVEVVSSTSVKVRLRKLTSALGAGNTWAAYDGGFSLAMHGSPLELASTMAGMTQWKRKNVVSEAEHGWNAIVDGLGIARRNAVAEHTTAGEHDAVEVCRDHGRVYWDTATAKYELVDDGGTFTNVDTVSTGISEVTCAYKFASTSTMAVFLNPNPASATDLLIVNPDPVSDRKFRTYCFKYDFGALTWALYDGDFSACVYGA